MTVYINGTTGYSGPVGTIGDLTTTGNTTLGDATTDTLNVGAGGLVKDASGNVGIGTATPVQRLHLAQAGQPKIEFEDTTNSSKGRITSGGTTGSMTFDADPDGTKAGTVMTFNIDASERMRIDSNGKLLVGGAASDLSSTSQAMIMGSGGLAVQYTGTTGTFLSIVPGAANGTVDLKADARSGNYPAMTFFTSATERMRLDASGNLLIGRTSSLTYSEKIMVEGAIGLNTNPIRFYNSGAYYGGIGSSAWAFGSGSNTDLSVLSSDNLLFGAGGQARARITSAGDLLINAVSNGYSASVLIVANSGLRNAVVCQDSGTNYGTGYYYQWFLNSAGNSAGSISHTASTTIAFLTSSDKRLKHNIVDAPSALQKVNDVKVCSFDWIEDGHHVDYGFIAQDLYKVIPEAVGKGDDAETIEDPKGTWQVEYGRLTPILFKAIQELKAEFDAYKLTHP